MAFVPVATYLALKNDTQRAALAKLKIVTLQDLFNAVWIPSKRLPRVSSRSRSSTAIIEEGSVEITRPATIIRAHTAE